MTQERISSCKYSRPKEEPSQAQAGEGIYIENILKSERGEEGERGGVGREGGKGAPPPPMDVILKHGTAMYWY